MPANDTVADSPTRSRQARERALQTAARLFYGKGVRAVGMEEIVAQSGVAKTTIYRHFPTKDVLVQAFLDAEDAEFWSQWDQVVGDHCGAEALDSLAAWIGERVMREGYRGCPQINTAAEFADPAHQARLVASRHKGEMYRRLIAICAQAKIDRPDEAAMQIALLFDGAFTSGGRLGEVDAPVILKNAVRRLITD